MVGVQVGSNVAEGQGIVGGTLDLAAGEGARGIAVNQQRQQHRRVVGIAAPAA